LAEHNIGVLVVVDDSEHPVGIISERDIVRDFANNGDGMFSNVVGDVMTKDIITVSPDDELQNVSSIMTQKRIRHLPVLKGKNLIGMVSIGDIVKAQLDYFEHEAHTLRHYVSGSYG